MPVPFPALKPADFTLQPVQYPVKTFQSVSGTRTRRLYGKLGYGASWNMNFVVQQASIDLLLDAWVRAAGTNGDTLILPASIYVGFTPEEIATFPAYLVWRFAARPETERAKVPGWARVAVQLKGELS